MNQPMVETVFAFGRSYVISELVKLILRGVVGVAREYDKENWPAIERKLRDVLPDSIESSVIEFARGMADLVFRFVEDYISRNGVPETEQQVRQGVNHVIGKFIEMDSGRMELKRAQ